VRAGTGVDRANFLVARFTATGSLDTSFGSAHTGVVTTDVLGGSYDRAYALTLQPDGKILVGGFASPNTSSVTSAALVRYNANGSLDSSFLQNGVTTAVADVDPDHLSVATARAVVVQPDGMILMAGEGGYAIPKADGTYFESGNMVLLMRFNADGAPDTAYGPSGTGMVMTSLGFNARTSAMDLDADGRAVVVGAMNTAGPSASDPSPYVEYFALARFTAYATSPSPVQIGSFAASSTTVSAGSPATLTVGGVTTTNAGATVTKVAFYSVNSSGTEQLLGYGTANADGTWTLTFTADLEPESYTLLALAVDSEGDVSDPFSLTLEVV